MSQTSASYTISDLAGLAGSTPRTVRYYVAQGLLPPPIGAGPGAHYTDAHLERLRLIQRLQRQHLPLSEIRQRLAQLGAREVSELVAEEPPRVPPGSALDYVRTVLAGPASRISEAGTRGQAMPPPAAPLAPPGAAPAPAAMPAAPPARIGSALLRRAVEPAPYAAMSMPPLRDVAPPSVTGVAEAPADFTGSQVASAPDAPSAGAAAPATAGPDPDLSDVPPPEQRSQWDRIGLTSNIEIHVRRPLSRLENRRVERLITIARHMLREEQP